MESTTTPKTRRPLQVKAKPAPRQTAEVRKRIPLPLDLIDTGCIELQRAHKLLILLEVVLLETDGACLPEEEHIVNTIMHTARILDRVADPFFDRSTNVDSGLITLLVEARAIAAMLAATAWNGGAPFVLSRAVVARVVDALGDCVLRASKELDATPVEAQQP